MYNRPYQSINSYPVNFRGLNSCLYIPSGDSLISSELKLKFQGGRNIFTESIPLGETIVTIGMPRPNLTMSVGAGIDNIITVNSANVLKIIIVDALEPMDTIVTQQTSNYLQVGGEYDITNHVSMEIPEVIIRRIAGSNIDTDIGMGVGGAIIRQGSSSIDEYVTVNVDGEVVKLSALTECDTIVTVGVTGVSLRRHVYRGGANIEVEEKVELHSYVKQWALFIRPIVEAKVSSVIGKTLYSTIEPMCTMIADSWIRQWEIIISNKSNLQVSAVTGLQGSVGIIVNTTVVGSGSLYQDVDESITITTYTSVDVQGDNLFDSCPQLKLMEDKGCAYLIPEEEQDPPTLILIDRSCYRNL